jgi:hypothetical protein
MSDNSSKTVDERVTNLFEECYDFLPQNMEGIQKEIKKLAESDNEDGFKKKYHLAFDEASNSFLVFNLVLLARNQEERILELEQKVYEINKLQHWKSANIDLGNKTKWKAELIDYESFEFEEKPPKIQKQISKPRKLPPAYPKIKLMEMMEHA